LFHRESHRKRGTFGARKRSGYFQRLFSACIINVFCGDFYGFIVVIGGDPICSRIGNIFEGIPILGMSWGAGVGVKVGACVGLAVAVAGRVFMDAAVGVAAGAAVPQDVRIKIVTIIAGIVLPMTWCPPWTRNDGIYSK